MIPASPRESDPPKPFLQHLSDLRRALIGALASLLAGVLAAVPLAPRVFRLLQRPLAQVTGSADPFLRTLEVSGGITLAMRLVFWTGLLLSLPAILFFVGTFIAPGLTRRERGLIGWTLGAAAGLFILGAYAGYRFSLPLALSVMLRINEWMGIRTEWIVSSYVVFALQLIAAFGLSFEFPVVVVLLGRLRILHAAQLRAHRRGAIVGILILAAVLTPPDVVSQLLMAVPMLALFEISIWLVAASEKKRDP
jgi:sec-independent protein translocase protein TatC